MNPKTEVADSKHNGGTGNLPLPRGNLPRGSGHALGENWFAFNEMAPAQFRRVSGPSEPPGIPRPGVWTFCRAWKVGNANGVLKQSPRLAQSAYLGARVRTRCQPQRGCVPSPRSTSCGRNQLTNNDRHVRESSRNPVGVAVVLAGQRSPAVAGQRWAQGRSPVGAHKCSISRARAGSPYHPFQLRCSRKTKLMKTMDPFDSRALLRMRAFP